MRRGSRRIVVRHAAHSRLLRTAPLDKRSAVGRAYYAELQGLLAHVGGEQACTVPQRALIEQAARLAVLEGCAWSDLLRGLDPRGRSEIMSRQRRNSRVSMNFLIYLKSAKERRQVLLLLGLQRHAKQMPTLDEFLASRTNE